VDLKAKIKSAFLRKTIFYLPALVETSTSESFPYQQWRAITFSTGKCCAASGRMKGTGLA
jgi:hypothetical protein